MEADNPLPIIMRQNLFSPRLLLIALLALTIGPEEVRGGLNGLVPVPLQTLSDHNISQMGNTALSIRNSEWNHAETDNFVYHFFHSFIATPVSVEAEFYYRLIAKELDRDTAQWERKSHIYIFEDPKDWELFQQKAFLDPWTGGIHSNGDLFVVRDPKYKFKGHALAHEVTHLVLHRFFGNGIPLWLNEGYSEYSALHVHALFMLKRGYMSRQNSARMSVEDFIPLNMLADITQYPKDEHKVEVFYLESEKLVRFMALQDKPKLAQFVECMSKGNRFESALWKSYGARFANLDMLQSEFKVFALKLPVF